MALVVEGKKTSGIIGFLIWLAVLLILGAGLYYIFFKQPDLIPITPPAGLETGQKVSQLKLDPESVTNDPKFVNLRTYHNVTEATTTGRDNPFQPL